MNLFVYIVAASHSQKGGSAKDQRAMVEYDQDELFSWVNTIDRPVLINETNSIVFLSKAHLSTCFHLLRALMDYNIEFGCCSPQTTTQNWQTNSRKKDK